MTLTQAYFLGVASMLAVCVIGTTMICLFLRAAGTNNKERHDPGPPMERN